MGKFFDLLYRIRPLDGATAYKLVPFLNRINEDVDRRVGKLEDLSGGFGSVTEMLDTRQAVSPLLTQISALTPAGNQLFTIGSDGRVQLPTLSPLARDLLSDATPQAMRQRLGAPANDLAVDAAAAHADAQSAADSKSLAAASETNAASAATAAQAAAALAAASRDAAVLAVTTYTDVTAGLAATAVGGQFAVVTARQITRYRVDAGPTLAVLFTMLTTLGQLMEAAVWSPAKLMLKGGVSWYDSQDIGSMFQDVNGTTPAVVGQIVALWLDKIGTAHAKQTTPARCPILRQAVTGQYWLDFYNNGDGQARWLDTSSGGQSPQFSVFALARFKTGSSSTTKSLVSGRSGTNTGWALDINNAGPRASIYNGASGLTNSFAFPYTATLLAPNLHPLLCGAIYDGANVMATEDGDVNTPSAATLAGNATAGLRFGWPKYTTAGTQSPVWLGDIITCNFAASQDDVRQLAAWVRANRSTAGRDASALAALRAAIEGETSDLRVLVVGDSTGDAQTEKVFKLATRLAREYPRLGVAYRLYDYDTASWGATIVLQASSNGFTLTFDNTSKSLSMPRKMMASCFTSAISTLPRCDLKIWNHGKNVSRVYPLPTRLGEFLAAMEQVDRAWPNAPQVALLQNPNLFDDDRLLWEEALRAIYKSNRRLQIIDTGAAILAAGRPPAMFVDADSTGMHPSQIAADMEVDAIMAAWRLAGTVAGVASVPTTTISATNLLVNGDFAAFPGAVPTDWAAGGGAAISKDATRVDPENPAPAWSVKVANGNGYLSQVITDPAKLAAMASAGSITLWFREYTIAGQTNAGEAQIIITSPSEGTVISTSIGGHNQGGAFYDGCVASVDTIPDATSVEVRLLSANFAGAFEANFSRAVLVTGPVPHKM